MSVHKRKYRSGIVWYYSFDLPGSGHQDRRRGGVALGLPSRGPIFPRFSWLRAARGGQVPLGRFPAPRLQLYTEVGYDRYARPQTQAQW